MRSQEEIFSLLLDVDDGDFSVILNDYKDHINGVNFIYAIDPYEILEYCYPFGLKFKSLSDKSKGFVSGGKLDYISSKQFVYHQLFQNNSEKIVLLDEYLVEMINIKRYIENVSKSERGIIKELDEFREEYYKRKNKYSDKDEADSVDAIERIRNLISSNLSLILSLMEDSNNSGMRKLVSLFQSDRIIVDQSDFTDSEDDIILNSVFARNRGSELQTKLLEIIPTYDSDSHNAQFQNTSRLINRSRDALVIDRILSINRDLEKEFTLGNIHSRYKVVYFSSTHTSKLWFSKGLIDANLPIIDGIAFNPLRTCAQMFLRFLCFAENMPIEMLEDEIVELRRDFSSIRESKEDIYKSNYVGSSAFSKKAMGKIQYYQKRFESEAILNRSDKIQNYIIKAHERLHLLTAPNEFEKELITLLEVIIEETREKTGVNVSSLQSFEDLFMQSQVISLLRNMLESLSDGTSKLRPFKGDDSIRGRVHHLPILFNIAQPQFKNIVNSISSFIVYPKTELLYGEIKQLARSTYKGAVELRPSLEERLLKAFMLMLMPPLKNGDNNNKVAYEWAQGMYKNEIVNKPHHISHFEQLDRDFLYFLSWASRRYTDYSASRDYLNMAIQKYPDDPRFYHGLFLTEYCGEKDRSNRNRKIGIDLSLSPLIINECVALAEEALRLYRSNKLHFGIAQEHLVDKTINALLNSLCFLFSELSTTGTHGSQDYLATSKRYMEELVLAEVDFDKYPEYLHSGAYLEYLEALQLIQEGKLAAQKLEGAYDKISRAIDLLIIYEQPDDSYEYNNLMVRVVNALTLVQRK